MMEQGEHQQTSFISLPSEIRLLIYGHLLDDGGLTHLPIRSLPEERCSGEKKGFTSRTKYVVVKDRWWRSFYETSYHLATAEATFHTTVMATCRQVYHETLHILYGRHAFDFGADTDAIIPFFADRTAPWGSLSSIHQISFRRRAAFPPAMMGCAGAGDAAEWSRLCNYLGESTAVRRLRLTVEGGQPPASPPASFASADGGGEEMEGEDGDGNGDGGGSGSEWVGPRELTASDLRLLTMVRYEGLEWVGHLARIKGVKELEIAADVRYMPPPTSTAAMLFAAFSASIETGFKEFLRAEMGAVLVK